MDKVNTYKLRVISGGQTGVDQAALDAAIELGLPYGGWLPKGRLTENGTLPESYVGMREMPTKDYLKRTEQNVVDSDLTVVICHGEPTGGTKRTVSFAQKHEMMCEIVDLDDGSAQARLVARLRDVLPRLLAYAPQKPIEINFAGPRGSKAPAIYGEAKEFIINVLKALEGGESEGGEW